LSTNNTVVPLSAEDDEDDIGDEGDIDDVNNTGK